VRKKYHDRMYRRHDPIPAVVVPVDPVPTQTQCPHCGAARVGQWVALSHGKGDPYRECRACGAVYCFLPGGMMRRVR